MALSSDSEAFTRSDSVLPVSAGRSIFMAVHPAPRAAGFAAGDGAGETPGCTDGGAVASAGLRVRYASAPSRALVSSLSEVGRSTCRSRRTWYAASRVLYSVLSGVICFAMSGGTTWQDARTSEMTARER